MDKELLFRDTGFIDETVEGLVASVNMVWHPPIEKAKSRKYASFRNAF